MNNRPTQAQSLEFWMNAARFNLRHRSRRVEPADAKRRQLSIRRNRHQIKIINVLGHLAYARTPFVGHIGGAKRGAMQRHICANFRWLQRANRKPSGWRELRNWLVK